MAALLVYVDAAGHPACALVVQQFRRPSASSSSSARGRKPGGRESQHHAPGLQTSAPSCICVGGLCGRGWDGRVSQRWGIESSGVAAVWTIFLPKSGDDCGGSSKGGWCQEVGDRKRRRRVRVCTFVVPVPIRNGNARLGCLRCARARAHTTHTQAGGIDQINQSIDRSVDRIDCKGWQLLLVPGGFRFKHTARGRLCV
jgi:hypothetical protein